MSEFDSHMRDGEVMLLERQIGVIPLTVNGRERLIVRLRPDLVKHFCLHLQATFEPTGIANMHPDAPWNAIERVQISTPRGEILKDVLPRALANLNVYELGTWYYSTFPIFPGLQVYTSGADLIVPFQIPTAKLVDAFYDPEKTILNTNEFTELYIDVYWRDPATQWYDETVTISACEIQVVSFEKIPVSVAEKLSPRKKLIDLSNRYLITGEETQVLLPENTEIKTIQIITYVKDVNHIYTRTDGILDRLRIEDDDQAQTMRSLLATEIRSLNKQYYGLELNNGYGNGQMTGIYVIEFDQMRDLSSLYDTSDLNYPKLILDFIPAIIDGTQHYSILIRQVTTPPALTYK